MDEKFIENKDDLKIWANDVGCEIKSLPKKYPCVAKTYVSSWRDEELAANFLYKEDIAALMHMFNQPTC